MPRKRHFRSRRDRSEVSCCIKYLMFGFNVMFWFVDISLLAIVVAVNGFPQISRINKNGLVGMTLLAIGLWAWAEKEVYSNLTRLTNVTLDPALLFIVVGMSMFSMSFTGCVGALRENTCLLLFFMVSLAIIFLVEILICILGFVYKDWVRDQIHLQVRNMIVNYRDDLDLKNLVDWIQQDWLKCCGMQSSRDWELNVYFNCSSPGAEACGVPFSCCKLNTEYQLVNRQCGFGIMRDKHNYDRGTKIHQIGCIPAGEKWLESNFIPVAGVAVGVALLQILGFCFAQNLRSDINAQRAKWNL